jgi:hypothetical protein
MFSIYRQCLFRRRNLTGNRSRHGKSGLPRVCRQYVSVDKKPRFLLFISQSEQGFLVVTSILSASVKSLLMLQNPI